MGRPRMSNSHAEANFTNGCNATATRAVIHGADERDPNNQFFPSAACHYQAQKKDEAEERASHACADEVTFGVAIRYRLTIPSSPRGEHLREICKLGKSHVLAGGVRVARGSHGRRRVDRCLVRRAAPLVDVLLQPTPSNFCLNLNGLQFIRMTKGGRDHRSADTRGVTFP